MPGGHARQIPVPAESEYEPAGHEWHSSLVLKFVKDVAFDKAEEEFDPGKDEVDAAVEVACDVVKGVEPLVPFGLIFAVSEVVLVAASRTCPGGQSMQLALVPRVDGSDPVLQGLH